MKRLQYIDALRGLTILLVVFHHELGKTGPLMTMPSAVAIREAFATFRMPLFFFVSGFFAFRAAQKWTPELLRRVFTLKAKAQILGTLVFAGAFFYIFHPAQLTESLTHIGASPYWFTISLLQMFIVYIGVMLLCRGKRPSLFVGAICTLAVASIGFHLWVSSPGSQWMDQSRFSIGEGMAWGRTSLYFPYFVAGLMARYAGEKLFKLLDNRAFQLIVVAGFLVGMYFVLDFPLNWQGKLLSYVPGFCGVSTLLALFYSGREYFEKNTRLTRIMTYVGRHTLDIYFLHYFFLLDLAFVPLYVYQPNPIVPMLVIVLGVSAIVVAISLAVSRVIRTSPILANYLFGAKPATKKAVISAPVAPTPQPAPAYTVQVAPRNRLTPVPHQN